MAINKNKRQEAANLHYKYELINNNLLELYYKITKNHTSSQNVKKEKIGAILYDELQIYSKRFKYPAIYPKYNRTICG